MVHMAVDALKLTLQQQESTKRILVGTKVTKGLDTQFDGKGVISESLKKLQPMVSFRWLSKVWISTIIPVKVASIHNNASNGSTVAAMKTIESIKFTVRESCG